MASTDIILPAGAARELPAVRSIGVSDLRDALAKGLQDFWAMPTHVIFLGLIYPVVGLVLFRAMFGQDLIPLLYPLAAGFPLVGPFAAIGLYELSRRRELGLDTSWKHAFDIIHSPSLQSIAALGLLLLALVGVWLAVAQAIYNANFGSDEPLKLAAFVQRVLTTPEGYKLIVAGNAAGFVFAALAFSLSVVSFPLLLDRNVGVAAAIATSIRVILRNPVAMALWAILVAGLLVIGSLPFFLGEDGISGLGPDERFGIGVVAVEVVVDRVLEVGNAPEDAAAETLAGDLGEEALDEVEPGSAGRREVHVEARSWRARAAPGVFVRGVVVDHEVEVEVVLGAGSMSLRKRMNSWGRCRGRHASMTRRSSHRAPRIASWCHGACSRALASQASLMKG